jgi:hypothetical protein
MFVKKNPKTWNLRRFQLTDDPISDAFRLRRNLGKLIKIDPILYQSDSTQGCQIFLGPNTTHWEKYNK